MLKVTILRDYESISIAAAELLIPVMANTMTNFYLGLATGSSPIGLYNELIKKQKEFDASKITTYNLDEYIGLEGDYPEERRWHPESYFSFMDKNLFSKLNPRFKQTYIPQGHLIEVGSMERELIKYNIPLLGDDSGKAIDFSKISPDSYLAEIKRSILDSYINRIKNTGVDYWIVGVGGKGHIAFHESGIPLDLEMLIVKLDDNTIQNAIKDGHFNSYEEAPHWAISVGASGVLNNSKNIIVLASGQRKTQPIYEGLRGEISSSCPISIIQRCIASEKNAYVFLDEEAGSLVKQNSSLLKEKGIDVKWTKRYYCIF